MDKAEKVILAYIDGYLKENHAARKISKQLEKLGIGFRPIVDHITLRTTHVYERAVEFLRLGYTQDLSLGQNGILDYGDWFAIVL